MERFQPYWLIHEPGKEHGFAVVSFFPATNVDEAVAEWRKATDPKMLELFEAYGTEITARLIKTPLV